MIHLSRRLYYAMEAVLFIAYNSGSGLVGGKEIATSQNVPTRYLEPMMQKLVRSGVLRGVRGPRGGYALGREKRLITLAQVCDALDDDESAFHSTPLGNKVILPAMEQLRESMYQQLDAITLSDLCERAAQMRVARNNESPHDFTI